MLRVLSWERAYPRDQGLHHGLRLLWNERVARVVDHNQCDAIAEFVLHFTALGLWFERILCSLQVEERRAAAGPPLVLFHGSHGGALAVANLRMPSGEPDCCIIAGSEEGETQCR